ncbi:lysine exporter LysO family protein [Ursidibacter maritimus]|uniref:lysine exporter LysO family protein n=1 Tax=Ursidibacter maritimus TaxID=1331689 RepID=UPI001C492E41|nr:lysine exporter LysO family protein [Ursidibacter maritimus]MBV6540171.1 lysine exporter LysO family protein [Ursidibacter maritimus]
MIYGLLIAFVPLFLGYLFRVHNPKVIAVVNKTTMYSLYLILLIMGIALGQLDDLETKLPQIGLTALGLSTIIHCCNIGSLMLFDKLYPMKRTALTAEELPSRWKQLLESSALCSAVLAGGIFGFVTKGILDFPLHSSTYVLVVMIFCVGIQLRNSGIPLKEVFLNKRGIFTALIFMGSGLLGGVISAYLLGLPLFKALAFASGFGWYSLSSVLVNDAWGPVYGSIAFFNDLSREIFCLFSIPFFMRMFPSTAVGLGGATSLDCTLPVIQKSGGMQVVPLAISFGFIVNLAIPFLLPMFIGMAS